MAKKKESFVDTLARVSRSLVNQAYAKGQAEAYANAAAISRRGGFKNPEEVALAIEEASKLVAPMMPEQPDQAQPPAESYATGMNIFNPTQ